MFECKLNGQNKRRLDKRNWIDDIKEWNVKDSSELKRSAEDGNQWKDLARLPSTYKKTQ